MLHVSVIIIIFYFLVFLCGNGVEVNLSNQFFLVTGVAERNQLFEEKT